VLGGVDVSNLFARYRFPKLHNLDLLCRFEISSWEHLKSTTTTLINLSLDFNNTIPSSAVPTTSQILSLLASNPNLRSLTLITLSTDNDCGDGSRLQVPLRHLERVSLVGTFRSVFPILHRLEFPERMDRGEITIDDCTPQEVLAVIGPYIRDYLQRDARFRDRLGMYVSSTSYGISFHASAVGVDRLPQDCPPYAKFMAKFSQLGTYDAAKKLCFDVLTLLPQEGIVSFGTGPSVTEEVAVTMPNLEVLCLLQPVVSDGFLLPNPNGPNADKKLLPSLRKLYLEDARAKGDNWDPLVTYLAHQTSGGQTISLKIFGRGVHICPEVIKRIEDLVQVLIYKPVPGRNYYSRCLCDAG
jgi:hypothetical protein